MSYKVKCVGYNQNHEKYFTKGKTYEVTDDRITCDLGYTYRGFNGEDVITWLKPWYEFERIDESIGKSIERVIFNDPATIILWNDGTKTVAKCCEGDKYDAEKGFCIAYLKKMLGTKEFSEELHKWVKEEEKSYKTKPPFNVGDRVKIVNHHNDWWDDEGEMDKWMGKIMTIREAYDVCDRYMMNEDQDEHCGFGWVWGEADFARE